MRIRSGVVVSIVAAMAAAPSVTARADEPHGPGESCAACCPAGPAISGVTGAALLAVDEGDTSADPVLHVFDLGGFAAVPPGYWSPPRYAHPSWSRANLGTVFGVTADEQGDVYLSHASFMTQAQIGAIGGGAGAIVRINGLSGAPSVLASLPQSNPIGGAGLGNLTWSCAHASLFVTNFEDGRIYRVDPSAPPGSRIASAWDFATDLLDPSGAPEVGDAPGAAPKGERVWAVAVSGDRLFFSVWSRDRVNPEGPANAIWSVALDASGDPIPGTRTLEILFDDPARPPMPVADLCFDGNCCLFAAQRSMSNLGSSAHESDLLSFCWTETSPGAFEWTQGSKFIVGVTGFGDLEHSAGGGVTIDPSPNGRVWATGDTLLLDPLTYGVQGLPPSGGDTSDSLLIDTDGDADSKPTGDKAAQGGCEFVCAAAPGCDLAIDEVECVLGPDGLPTGQYQVTATMTNSSGQAATSLLIRTLGQVINLNPPLPSGQSVTFSVVISGSPGDLVNLLVGLYSGGTACCGDEASIVLPECRCALFADVEVECIFDGDATTNQYAVTFTIKNIATNPSFTATWFFLIPPAGAPYSFSPTVINVFPLPPGGQTNVATTLTFSVPPVPGPDGLWSLDVPVSLHNANLAICCDTILHLEGPWPCDPECSPDLNHDGLVDGADLAIMLGVWGTDGAGTCADLNGDGIVDGADLAILLGAWAP